MGGIVRGRWAGWNVGCYNFPMAAKHPDQTSFERTIAAHPYDPAPRLIYADWCADRGLVSLELRLRLWPVLDNPDDMEARLYFADWLALNRRKKRAAYIRDFITNPRMKNGKPVLESCMCGSFPETRCKGCKYLGIDDRKTKRAAPNANISYFAGRGFVEVVRLQSSSHFEPLAKLLFERHPIRDVWFSDLRPDLGGLHGHPEQTYVWSCAYDGWPYPEARPSRRFVPSALWPFLERETGPDGLKVYENGRLAMDDLTDAAVRYGRDQASLRPWKHERSESIEDETPPSEAAS